MCVFCKIASGEFSSYKIYEDDTVLAFLDLSQATKGHTLVIPKKHYENIFDIDKETLEHIYSVVKLICDHYKQVIPNLKGINLLNNNGAKAGQVVPHYHVHILPRYEEDDLVDMKFVDHSKTSNLAEICDELKIK